MKDEGRNLTVHSAKYNKCLATEDGKIKKTMTVHRV